jgi:hypothetical protein
MPAINVIKLRRGTAAQWTSANPTLSAGEMGIETDTGRSKYGNGSTAWTTLTYSVGNSSGIGSVAWTAVTAKPTTFTPSAHNHVKAEITDFAHVHPISEVTDLQTELDDLQTGLDSKKAEAIYEIAADVTLLANSRYFVDTSAARTLTLPSAPAVGAEIWIADEANSAATNNITVNNGGSLINGVSDTLVIDVSGAVATLVYTGSTLGWRI